MSACVAQAQMLFAPLRSFAEVCVREKTTLRVADADQDEQFRQLYSCLEDFSNLPIQEDLFFLHASFLFSEKELEGHIVFSPDYVADYLTQLRTSEEYDPPPGRIGHPDETLKLMGAITGDSVFQDMVNSLPPEKKEELTMRKFYEFAHDPRVEERDRKLEERDRKLEERDRKIAEYERRLKEYERENAELKQRLGSV